MNMRGRDCCLVRTRTYLDPENVPHWHGLSLAGTGAGRQEYTTIISHPSETHEYFDHTGSGHPFCSLYPVGRDVRIHRVTKPTDITAVVIDVAREQVGIDVPVSVESPLFAGGLGLDSIGCLDLILTIEA